MAGRPEGAFFPPSQSFLSTHRRQSGRLIPARETRMDFHRPETITPLTDGWSLISSEAGAYASPADIPPTAETLPAAVPGTVAGALHDAGRFDPARPEPLDHRDHWYRLTLTEAPG